MKYEDLSDKAKAEMDEAVSKVLEGYTGNKLGLEEICKAGYLAAVEISVEREEKFAEIVGLFTEMYNKTSIAFATIDKIIGAIASEFTSFDKSLKQHADLISFEMVKIGANAPPENEQGEYYVSTKPDKTVN